MPRNQPERLVQLAINRIHLIFDSSIREVSICVTGRIIEKLCKHPTEWQSLLPEMVGLLYYICMHQASHHGLQT